MTSAGPDHKLAQALDLARREAALTTAQLAQALSFNPRTVRRYLNGERRPDRDTIVRWEQACKIPPGRLVALYDGPPAHGVPPPRLRARLALRCAVAAAVLFVALAAVLLLREGDEQNGGAAAQQRLTRVTYHRFATTYVGDVWIRITPAGEHAGQRHRVTLRWGPLQQQMDLKNLDRARTLFTGKGRPDHVPMRVDVTPAATIAFGEDNVPAGAVDIKPRWKTGG